jgi:hypothetical protein
MNPIPIYLKNGPESARPNDPEFYWMTASGLFFGRNHAFFTSDVPARRSPRSLAPHQAECLVRYPRLGQAALEYIVGFFGRVFEEHGAESIVLLYWDLTRRRYRLRVPPQQATVWESSSGRRSAMDVAYQVPVPTPKELLLVADIHCHCDFGAYASSTDARDELYRDGVHAVVGRIDQEPPEFHLELAVDGHRFGLKFDQLFRGYKRRRLSVPRAWLDQVKIKVQRPQSWIESNQGYGGYGSYSSQGYGHTPRSGRDDPRDR